MTTYSWSIDDAGVGGSAMVESLRRATEFFNSRGLETTRFTVPKAGGKPMNTGWRGALIAARDAGHDLKLHGLTHADGYKFGPPAWPETAVVPALQSEFDKNREDLMSRYTVDNLWDRLEVGMKIFALDLGVEPTRFRAPCCAISKAMFRALHEVGISYHSSTHISGSGYGHLPHNGGQIAQKWVDSIPYRPVRWYEGVVEVSILNEYAWCGSGQRSEEFIELARRGLDRIDEQSPVVVLLMHTQGIADDYENAFRFSDAVSEHVGRKPGASFATMGALAASGALKAAATVDGPDIQAV